MQAGVTADRQVHAVFKRWFGYRPLCGTGRIELVLDRPFQPGHYTCANCLRMVQERGGPGPPR